MSKHVAYLRETRITKLICRYTCKYHHTKTIYPISYLSHTIHESIEVFYRYIDRCISGCDRMCMSSMLSIHMFGPALPSPTDLEEPKPACVPRPKSSQVIKGIQVSTDVLQETCFLFLDVLQPECSMDSMMCFQLLLLFFLMTTCVNIRTHCLSKKHSGSTPDFGSHPTACLGPWLWPREALQTATRLILFLLLFSIY